MLQVRDRDEDRETLVEVGFAAVAEILSDGVTMADGTFLPYHRIVAVRRGREDLWRRSPGHEK